MNHFAFRYEDHFVRIITVLFAGIIMVSLGIFIRPAEAHTAGKMQLAAAPAGPYQMTVWTSPDPATVGDLHVALAVVLAEDASPVLDATVTVQLTPLDGGNLETEPATTDNSENKFLYEAIFEPAAAGLYQIDIQVSGVDGAVGDANFELEITDGSGFNWLYLIPAGLGLAAVALLVYALRRQPASG